MNNRLTEIIFLLDRSGSMSGLEKDTIGGFNAFMEKQNKLGGKTLVTTVLFDHEYELLWNGANANQVKLTDKEYQVRGTTALLDAVGKTILDVGHRLSETNEEKRPDQILFVITTDGMENASNEFTYEKVKSLINHQQEKYGWEFIFLGANMDTASEAVRIGINRKDAFDFDASANGVMEMYDVVYKEMAHRRNG